MEPKIHLKSHKIAKGAPQGPPNGRKGRKKGITKTKPKNNTKGRQKALGRLWVFLARRNARGWPLYSPEKLRFTIFLFFIFFLLQTAAGWSVSVHGAKRHRTKPKGRLKGSRNGGKRPPKGYGRIDAKTDAERVSVNEVKAVEK